MILPSLIFFLLFPTIHSLTNLEVTSLCIISNSTYREWNCSKVSSACEWPGITCSGKGNVISLDTSQTSLTELPTEIGHLTYLQKLELYYLEGTVPTEIGYLRSLTYLSISYSQKSSIPTQIGLLTLLNTLEVDVIYWNGTIPTQIGRLSNLTRLVISNSYRIHGTIPTEIGMLSRLKRFDFYSNMLSGTIPNQIGYLTNLEYFDVGFNKLNGTIPTQMGKLTLLTSIGFLRNKLSSTVPTELKNLKQISQCYLQWNSLSGEVPTWLYHSNNTDSLDLGNNKFSVIPKQIGDFVNLKRLDFRNNDILEIPNQFGKLTKLIDLILSDNLIRSFPQLKYLTSIERLQLDNNILNIPLDDFLSMENVSFMFLQNNKIYSTIPSQINKLQKLVSLNLYDNELYGTIPDQLYKIPSLRNIFLGENPSLGGIFPTVVNDFQNWINLANNKFTGTIPSNLNYSGFMIIDVQGNRLTGTIPTELGRIGLSISSSLNLNGNQLSGTIPTEFINLTSLELSNNDITGTLPKLKAATLDISSLKLNGTVNFVGSILRIDYNSKIIACNLSAIYCSAFGVSFNCQCGKTKCLTDLPCCWPQYDLNCPLCDTGFRRKIIMQECEDIDECETKNGDCSDICTNTVGSFYCSCFEGKIQLTDGSCQDQVSYTNLGIALGSIAFIIIVLLLISFTVHTYLKNKRRWENIPPELNWMIRSASSLTANIAGWKRRDSYFINKLLPNTPENLKAVNFLETYLDFKGLSIKSLYAIDCPRLSSMFSLRMSIMKDRKRQNQMEIKKFSEKKKLWTLEKYQEVINKCEWNDNLDVPIIPVVHGTDFTTAALICDNGFANLSTVDLGYYGKGIYFTRSAKYALPYAIAKSKPTIIVCYLLPGNPYPVTESSLDKNRSMCGRPVPISAEFDSHYVITNKKGEVVNENDLNSGIFDEFVVGQETQVLPVYVVILDENQKK